MGAISLIGVGTACVVAGVHSIATIGAVKDSAKHALTRFECWRRLRLAALQILLGAFPERRRNQRGAIDRKPLPTVEFGLPASDDVAIDHRIELALRCPQLKHLAGVVALAPEDRANGGLVPLAI